MPLHPKQAGSPSCHVCCDLNLPRDGSWLIPSLEDARRAVARGCPFCDIIVQAIQGDRSSEEEADGSLSTPDIDDQHIVIGCKGWWLRLEIQYEDDKPIELFQLPDHRSSSFPGESSHAVSGNFKPNLPLHQVKRWLQECLTTHKHCFPFASSLEISTLLPRMVIDVTPNHDLQAVRLVKTSRDQKAPYVCLSHCWGQTSSPLKTTRVNLNQHLRSIDWLSLPKTFQEAIEFVRLLGQRYLWIDSLCIIQDDEQDWEEQSVQMASIYQNAYLTLAATKAKDSREGLFNEKNNFEHVPISSLDKDGLPIVLLRRNAINHWYWVDGSPSSMTQLLRYPTYVKLHFPLLHRAWVLQERLLSPRILHFGPAELLWECCERFTCECRDGIDDIPQELYPKVQHSRSLKSDYGIARHVMWQNIVYAYSHLGITKHEDRLPGLQGIARQLFENRAPFKILSGLWEETLVQHLMWRSQYHPVESRKGGGRDIPTWSWATMQTGVFYELDAVDIAEYATIEGYDVQDPGDDRTIITATNLKVSAILLPGRIVYDRQPSDSRSRRIQSEYAPFDDWIGSADFIFDGRPPLTPQKPFNRPVNKMTYPDWNFCIKDEFFIASGSVLYCLFMATISAPDERREFGLLVKHAENGRMRFERVGCFVRTHSPEEPYEPTDGHVTSLEEMFEGAERTTITII